MDPENVLEELREFFLQSGFNLTLTIDPVEYANTAGTKKHLNTLLPEVKSILLIGFSGKSFWGVFQEYLKNNPEYKSDRINLIDDYSVLKFKEASHILNKYRVSHKSVYPFGENALDLNFLKLGELAGAGVKSLLGILLHPLYGPWISLRGAILTNLMLNQFDSPLSDFTPCPSCNKPCISVCPANTISESGWDWESCMKFRLSDDTCAKSCASRRACPYGKQEQYSEQQLEYHHNFVLNNVKEYFDKKP
jgi:epoxyqueuosine reductase QueG